MSNNQHHIEILTRVGQTIVFNPNAALNFDMLRETTAVNTVFPSNIRSYGNCCWVNVWTATLYAMGSRMSCNESDLIVQIIQAAGSRMQNIRDMIGKIIERTNLKLEIIEFNQVEGGGATIGRCGGDVISFVNTGNHYQIWLPPASDLRSRFAAKFKGVAAAKFTPKRSATQVKRSATQVKRSATQVKRSATQVEPVKRSATQVKSVEYTQLISLAKRHIQHKRAMITGDAFTRLSAVDQVEWVLCYDRDCRETMTKSFKQSLKDKRDDDASIALARRLTAEDRIRRDSVESESRRIAQSEHTLAQQEDASRALAIKLSTPNGC
jgi:hypothetical protein